MKHENEMVNMNFSVQGKIEVVPKNGRTIDTVEILRLEDLFSIEITIFQFKLMSEHASGLCSDLITFCERSGRWSHRVSTRMS